MSGPEVPSDPPGRGDPVLIRYHTSSGTDGAVVGEVEDVSGGGAYSLTVRVNAFKDVMVNTDTLAVTSTFPPDEDGVKRLGILKVIRPAPGGELPEVDRQVQRFNSIATLACGECDGGTAVVRSGEPHCGECGARVHVREDTANGE